MKLRIITKGKPKEAVRKQRKPRIVSPRKRTRQALTRETEVLGV